MKFVALLIALLSYCAAGGQNDAYIKLNDAGNTHPRVISITFPGDADNMDMYNSIFGHGAVIENPWVAFRVYMDNRQSLDLYVKATPRLELETTGFYTTPSQIEQGYGCDVLWAGTSIGAGSFRGWQNDDVVTVDSVAFRTQTVINDSVIEVVDTDWIFNGHPLNMTQRYMMKSDKRDLEVEIQLAGYSPDDVFATGVQKFENHEAGFVSKELLKAASWGSNVPDKAHPELVETVGLALLVNPANLYDIKETENNYLFLLKPDSNGKIRYKVLACGTREKEGFRNAEQWFEYIKQQ